jgi:hypothetical protein
MLIYTYIYLYTYILVTWPIPWYVQFTGEFYDRWPIPLVASKQNLKSPSGVRSFQRALLDGLAAGDGLVLVGVHLCGLLALRAVQLLNANTNRVRLFALKPCCLPGMQHAKQQEYFSIGRHQFPTASVCSTGKYEAQSKTNVSEGGREGGREGGSE